MLRNDLTLHDMESVVAGKVMLGVFDGQPLAVVEVQCIPAHLASAEPAVRRLAFRPADLLALFRQFGAAVEAGDIERAAEAD